jgi:zinc protease
LRAKGIKIEDADKAVQREIDKMKVSLVEEKELQKVKNKTEAALAFEDMSVMNRANSLAFYELLGNANLMNEEWKKYQALTTENIRHYCQEIFDNNNSNTIYYYSQN